MSNKNCRDFNERLAELNTWQIEQQNKLKAFQEAQRRLLDLEHQNVLNSLGTQNFNQRCKRSEEDISKKKSDKCGTESDLCAQECDIKKIEDIFQIKFQPIQLNEPKSSLFTASSFCPKKDEENFCNKSVENVTTKEASQPKKFLRRGDGLARFRMTLEDFKGPPKIYRESQIKTYLKNKPDFVFKNSSNKTVKPSKQSKRGLKLIPKMPSKSVNVPVNIYVTENKLKKSNFTRNLELKGSVENQDCKRGSMSQAPKPAVEDLVLKPSSIATEWYNMMKSKGNSLHCFMNENSENNSLVETNHVLDTEKKEDEKELKMFEILEQKVNDSSFCSTSSFVDKLVEQSMSSTPSKLNMAVSESCDKPYTQGLKSLCSQFLDEEQIKKFEYLNSLPSNLGMVDYGKSQNVTPEDFKKTKNEDFTNDERPKNRDREKVEIERGIENIEVLEKEGCQMSVEKKNEEDFSQPQKVNKAQLQEYIRDFKNLKFVFEENVGKIEESQKETSPPISFSEEKNRHINQYDIALKLQRKGLQDNVKQLLNWEGSFRKKQPKRVVKKFKTKAITKPEKLKSVEKDQGEKIIFNSGLLKVRLDELEKEIEIFRKENKNLEKLQKECNEERIKLSRERKEFEKQMQEEKEMLQVKIADEHKKLQRERNVFEKYCKQVKSHPSRQEREEITDLKNKLEKLTESLTTKESRWGASQARLRNQIKNLEKENFQLKSENEKYKKFPMKKVTFESEKNISTKIIHAINSELGKLKPKVIKSTNGSACGKNQSLSARLDRNLEEKPIRRTRSAPNMKKRAEIEVFDKGVDDKTLGSVSTDSGIETNGSRYAALPRGDEIIFSDILPGSNHDVFKTTCEANLERFHFDRPHSVGRSSENGTAKNFCQNKMNDCMESVVHEAVFENTDLMLSDVKKKMERLNLLMHNEENVDDYLIKMVKLPKKITSDRGNCGSEEISCDSAEEEAGGYGEDDDEDKEIVDYCEKKMTQSKSLLGDTRNCRNNVEENKLDDIGVHERILEGGAKEICYPNGNVKKIFPGNKIIKMNYYNGDIKETNVVEGSEKYYYAETKTWHTTYKDGLEVLEFPNGQTERRHANGSTEISFPNGCVRYCDTSGRDEWRFLDGTVIKTNENGHKILLMPNGQKEIHTKEFKRREYPDGTVKILYADGTQETRYASGRVRLKDKEGNLVMDSGDIR